MLTKNYVDENSGDEVIKKLEMQEDVWKFYRIFESVGHFFDASVQQDIDQNAYVSHPLQDGWQVWFCKKGVLRNFAKFTGKQNHFLIDFTYKNDCVSHD